MKEAQQIPMRVPVMKRRMFYRYRSVASSAEDCEEADSISECTSLTTSSLYEASKITVFDSYLLLFYYVTKHSLTHKAFTASVSTDFCHPRLKSLEVSIV